MTNINRNIILLLIITTSISIGYAYPYIGLTTIFDSGGARTLQGNVTINDSVIAFVGARTLQGNTIINDSGIVSKGKNLTNLCTGAFTYCIQNENGIITATNGSTGNIDYSGTFMSVMNQVTNISLSSVTKIILNPQRYNISFTFAPPHNRSIWLNKSNISIDGQGSIIYNDGIGTGRAGSYIKQGDNAISNIEITGIIFDDLLGNSSTQSTHQIIGFDGVVENIRIHHNKFINLYNSATIINTATSPYARNILYDSNRHSKNVTHSNGDFTEIMGKDIRVTNNYFEELTNPASALIVPSFGKDMIISGNIGTRNSPGNGDILLEPNIIMSGETYVFSNILVSGNTLTYGAVGIGAGNTPSMAGERLIFNDNNIVQGTIIIQGGVRDVSAIGNTLTQNSWISVDGQVAGVNYTQTNIRIQNNEVNASNNIGSILIQNQKTSSNYILSGNIISNENSANSIRIQNPDNNVTNLIISENICTIGKPVMYIGTIAGGNVSANNINC